MQSDTTDLSNICESCGGQNRPAARFCRQCGAALQAPPSVAVAPSGGPETVSVGTTGERSRQKDADVSARPSTASPPPPPAPPPTPRPTATGPGQDAKRPGAIDWRVLVPAGVGVALLLGLMAYVVVADPFNLFAPTIQAYANQDLVVVNEKNLAEATVLGHLNRGDAIKGKWTDRNAGRFRWLAVKWPGAKHAYVWGHAVSLKPRPELATQQVGPVPASIGSQVFAEPDDTAPAIDNLMPGESAMVVGATSNGWVEIALPVGGVGYVKRASFDGAVDPSAGLLGVAHYICTISPSEGTNVPSGTPNLSFVFDGNRQCLDHRYAYVTDETGGLKRVMFNDKEHRATLLYFTADRHSFQRTDLQLQPSAYQRLSKNEGALASLECPPPGDSSAAAATSKAMNKLIPADLPQTASLSFVKRVWGCKPTDDQPRAPRP